MSKVSVVVSVYNVEAYIGRCIDSIIGQTLKDIEIILIDDGSTDKSGVICDSYKQVDNRIKVIHKSNEGLSCARNDGISMSTSTFIMFVDGDDWVQPDFCEKPYRVALEYNADLVLFSYSKIRNNVQAEKCKAKYKEGIIDENKALRFNVFFACYAWIGLYERNLFDNIRFPEGMVHEDVGTTHRLIHCASKIIYIDACLYNYREHREGSITSSQSIRRYTDLKKMLLYKINDLCIWGYEGIALKDTIVLLAKYRHNQSEQKMLIDIVKRTKGRASSEFGVKEKIVLLLFNLSPVLFDLVCKLIQKRVELHFRIGK